MKLPYLKLKHCGVCVSERFPTRLGSFSLQLTSSPFLLCGYITKNTRHLFPKCAAILKTAKSKRNSRELPQAGESGKSSYHSQRWRYNLLSIQKNESRVRVVHDLKWQTAENKLNSKVTAKTGCGRRKSCKSFSHT